MQEDKKDKAVSTGKELAQIATGSLDDVEVTNIMKVVGELVMKYQYLPNTENNLSRLDDEANTRLYDMGYLVHLDLEPVLSGQPPVIEIMGKVGDLGFQAPSDHERFAHSVNKARSTSQYYLGQKEEPNSQAKAAKKLKAFRDTLPVTKPAQ